MSRIQLNCLYVIRNGWNQGIFQGESVRDSRHSNHTQCRNVTCTMRSDRGFTTTGQGIWATQWFSFTVIASFVINNWDFRRLFIEKIKIRGPFKYFLTLFIWTSEPPLEFTRHLAACSFVFTTPTVSFYPVTLPLIVSSFSLCRQ